MNYLILPFLCFSCLVLIDHASADTVLLNNGESYKGKIIFENDDYCTIEVQVTETIKDEKKFLKTNVKSITIVPEDLEKFEALKGLIPTPDFQEVKEYKDQIQKVELFVKEFSKSSKVEIAKKIVEELKAELEIISLGGMKFDGEMVSAAEYFANAYAYDQSLAVKLIHEDIEQRNYLGAIKLFSDYESKFGNGADREKLVPIMKQVLFTYKVSLSGSLANFDSRMKKREMGLARMSMGDRQRTERALEEQMVNLKARYDREKSTKNSWITPDANFKESLVDAIRQVDNEMKRLDNPQKSTLEIISLEDSYRQAWEQLPNASEDERKEILDRLKRERMPEYYINVMSARVKSE
jgi:hypothetical protein